MAERPDLIVLGGDYVTWGDRDYVRRSAAEALRAAVGAVRRLRHSRQPRRRPRHAGGADAQRRRHAEGRADARDRSGASRSISSASATGPGAAPTSRRSCAAPPGPIVLLAHDPRRLAEASALNVPLVLSGHTHGGQVVLPLIGAVAAQKFPVIAGIGRRDKTTMFVSRGVGTVYVPVRVNCPPEVAVLTLQPDAASVRRTRYLKPP